MLPGPFIATYIMANGRNGTYLGVTSDLTQRT